jgi:rhodanese-related sulfurtransferase
MARVSLRAIAGIAALMIIGLALVAMRDVDWLLLKRSLRARFHDVQWITTSELGDWLVDRNRRAPVLVDVRTEAEWNVSHLPGARRVEPGAAAEAAFPRLDKAAPIVTYCAIGYRSAEFATRLKAAGFSNVRNLEGSIFEWGNEHRPLVHDGQTVTKVHPYDRFWAHFVEPDVRASLSR